MVISDNHLRVYLIVDSLFFLSVSKSVFLDDEYQTAPHECINFTLSNFNANGELVILSDRRRQGDEGKGRFYGIHADVKLAKS